MPETNTPPARPANLTPAQSDAIYRTELSMALTSGAGCGKTYVLARRYVQVMEDDGKPDAPLRVVAVTFTEKAAVEMHQRVAELLGKMLVDAADPARKELLSEWISRLSESRISTIHGFCSALLRSCALEAGVDPDFGVLTEDFRSRRMLAEACSDATLRALEQADQAVTDLLETFTYQQIQTMLDELVQERWRWRPEDFANPKDTLARWDAQMEQVRQQAWTELDVPAIRAEMAWLADQPCDNPDDKLAVHRANQLAVIARLLSDPAGRTEQNFAAINPRPGGIGAASAWGSKQIVMDIRHRLNDLVAQFEPLGDLAAPLNEQDELAADNLAALTALAGEANNRYAVAKRRAGLLDFADLLLGARDLLRDNPSLRQRLALDIRQLLIDEFQDTDSLQRELLWLAVDCLEVAPPPGRIFFVGDDKQSIYRFRGAEVEVFRTSRAALGEAGRRHLDLNFRTHSAGVALVNRIFTPLMGKEYEPLNAHRPERPPGPAGEILLAQCDDGARAEDYRRGAARLVGQRIAEMVQGKERIVWDSTAKDWRPVRPGDITILMPQLQNTAAYEEALQDAGVNYYIVAGAGLYRQQEVFDLLNALRTIDNPLDDIALMGFLRGGMVGLDDNTLLHIARALQPPYRVNLRDPRLAERLAPADHARLTRAAEILEGLSAHKDSGGVDALIDRLLRETHFEAILLGQYHGLRKCGNIHRVLEHARTAQQAGATLREFIEYLSDLTLEEVREEQAATEAEGSDVVRLMTIHKAKGLEFPVVFLADLNHAPQGRPSLIGVRGPWGLTLRAQSPEAAAMDNERPQSYLLANKIDRQRDQAEDLRTFYVAVTRHCDHVVFVGGHEEKAGAFGRPNSFLRHLDQALGLEAALGSGRIRVDEQTEILVRSIRPRYVSRRGKTSLLSELYGQCDSPDALAEALAPPVSGLGEPWLCAEPAAIVGVERLPAEALADLERCPACFHWHHELRVPRQWAETGTGQAGTADALTAGMIFHRCLQRLDFANPQPASWLVRLAIEEERLDLEAGAVACELESMLACLRQHELWQTIGSARRRLAGVEYVTRIGHWELAGTLDLLLQDAQGQWRLIDFRSEPVPPDSGVEPIAASLELPRLLHASAGLRHLAEINALAGQTALPVTLYFLRAGLAHTWPGGAISPQTIESRIARLSERLASCRRDDRWPGLTSPACHSCQYAGLCHPGRV